MPPHHFFRSHRKDRANIAKHGISLAEAARLDWDAMELGVDDSQHYGEERWSGVAPYVDGPLHTVIFVLIGTDDVEKARIISLRPSSNQEKQTYVQRRFP